MASPSDVFSFGLSLSKFAQIGVGRSKILIVSVPHDVSAKVTDLSGCNCHVSCGLKPI